MDAYRPTHPQQLKTVSEVVEFLRKELEAISQSLAEFVALDLRTVYKEPVKPREGMIVSADGTSWNPGAGIGIYAYVGAAWVKLTGGAGSSTFLALTDTPANYTGAAGKEVRVNAAATALEFVESREKLVAARTYYIRADGSDANTGLVDTAGGAWRTPQKAMDYVARYLDFHAGVTIQLRTGTYDALYVVAHVGPGYLYFVGDTATPSNVVITETNALGGLGIALDFDGEAGFVQFEGIKFQNTTVASLYPCVYVGSGCRGEFRYMEYSTTSTAAHLIELAQGAHMTFTQTQKFTSTGTPTYQVYVGSNSYLWSNGGAYNINGLNGAYGFLNTTYGANLDLDTVTFTVVGNPTIYAFMECAHSSTVTLRNCTVVGTCAGSYRATIAQGAILDHNQSAGGETFLPGAFPVQIQSGALWVHSNGWSEVTTNLVGAVQTLTAINALDSTTKSNTISSVWHTAFGGI